MSIKSFIAGLWASVKKLFNGFSPELKTAVAIGVTLCENIKKVIDSPVADIATFIIPGQADDALKLVLRAALPKLLQQLGLFSLFLNSDPLDPDSLYKALVDYLRDVPANAPIFYHNLSILVAQIAADGKLTWSDGVVILEWYYKNEYKSQ